MQEMGYIITPISLHGDRLCAQFLQIVMQLLLLVTNEIMQLKQLTIEVAAQFAQFIPQFPSHLPKLRAQGYNLLSLAMDFPLDNIPPSHNLFDKGVAHRILFQILYFLVQICK